MASVELSQICKSPDQFHSDSDVSTSYSGGSEVGASMSRSPSSSSESVVLEPESSSSSLAASLLSMVMALQELKVEMMDFFERRD